MNIGIDIGYSAVKAQAKARRATFASVIGTPDRSRFSLNGTNEILLRDPHNVLVGGDAVTQSRFLRRREDRNWIESVEWYTLFLASLTELTTATRADVNVITGLPLAFYDDKRTVERVISGEHTVSRDGRTAQRFTVTGVRVIPQPFGALLSVCLNDSGRIVDVDLATGNVGVIDVGGKTTNLLAVKSLSEIARDTASVSVGAWDAVRGLRGFLEREYPDLELRDHEIAGIIQARALTYYGDGADIGDVIDEMLAPLAEQVIAEATQLWNGAAGLKAILVAGGGALLLGPYVKRHFRHAVVVDDPVFANAVGFWKFAERVWR